MINNLKGLYAITPSNLEEKDLLSKVKVLLSSGICLVQFRDKVRGFNQKLHIALKIKEICDEFKGTLIINDDPYLAKETQADGVHLGQDDMPCFEARDILGPTPIIGISCQSDLKLALKAVEEGANYVAFGSIFPSKTKKSPVLSSLNDLNYLASRVNVPIVAVGGINRRNIKKIKLSGAEMFGISSGLFEGNIAETVEKLKENLKG